jgi:hypothetical protein
VPQLTTSVPTQGYSRRVGEMYNDTVELPS